MNILNNSNGIISYINKKHWKMHRYIMINILITSKISTSKYIGVSFYKKSNKWRANIKVDGIQIYLGTFINEIEAAKVRDIATKQHFGEYGNLNFPVN